MTITIPKGFKIGQANDFKEAGGKTVNEMLEEIAGK